MLVNVIQYLQNSVLKFPDKTAIVDNGQEYSYLEVDKAAKCIATEIIEVSGCINSPVLIMMDKSMYNIATFMGVIYSYNYYVPLDCSMPFDRMKLIYKDLSPKVIITDKSNFELASVLASSNTKVILVDEEIIKNKINEDAIKRRVEKINDVDPVYIIYTSGSTGVPKGVVISHRAVIDFAESTSEYLKFDEKENFVSQAPFHFDASVPDLYCTLRNAATLHLVKKEMYQFPYRIVNYIQDKKINSIFWVPSVLVLLANSRVLAKANLSSLKKISFCGEVMPVKQLNIWKQYIPDAIYVNYYGPTETTYACTYYKIDREFDVTEKLPIGKACENSEVILIDKNGELAGKGCSGEICIKGTCLFNGYYNNKAKTDEVLIQNPLNKSYREFIYKTGDLGKYNEFGELEYISRIDYQVKHLGYRIELQEIEVAISSIEGIQMNCCLYDDEKQEIIAVYSAEKKLNIEEKLENKLPSYMIPTKFIYMESMPLNSNGKVDRKGLKVKLLNL